MPLAETSQVNSEMNIIGPSTEPCGKPQMNLTDVDLHVDVEDSRTETCRKYTTETMQPGTGTSRPKDVRRTHADTSKRLHVRPYQMQPDRSSKTMAAVSTPSTEVYRLQHQQDGRFR
jgi:hypothetical protein